MNKQTFTKLLTANDTGATGGHQAGILVPKGNKELITFLPPLDLSIKNPDTWISCTDEAGEEWSFRYVYYNNKFHDPKGTRNEYRITHMTKYLRGVGAIEGDDFQITGTIGCTDYKICVTSNKVSQSTSASAPIKLKGWRRIH